MMITTTDTVPRAYEVLGLVQTSFVANPPIRSNFARRTSDVTGESLVKAEAELMRQASSISADAVIGLRVQSLFGNNCVMMGTAVIYK